MTMQQDLLFAFGIGYVAEALGRDLLKQGWCVAGTVRSEGKAKQLTAAGFDVQIFDGSGGLAVPDGAHWLISIPPGATGCPAYLAASNQAAAAKTVTYLSTTGVYGDRQGQWVYEWSHVAPSSERARRRAFAELQWMSLGQKHAIVRLPGIYGPSRSPLDRVRSGTAKRIIKPGQVFSRVHVDDIASGLKARFERPETGGIFHLCDDEPAPPQDVIEHAASLLSAPVPSAEDFETADLSEMARSFYSECKRVANGRAKAALSWRPAYPTYRDGLAAILAAGG
ncbi:MAG: SDR family oxidoreductase [Pseudomonadota bacterium]